jgi:hypothetical protein
MTPSRQGASINLINFNLNLTAVEKRDDRSQDKVKFSEKAEFMSINEYFELDFNAVLTSVIGFQ